MYHSVSGVGLHSGSILRAVVVITQVKLGWVASSWSYFVRLYTGSRDLLCQSEWTQLFARGGVGVDRSFGEFI